MVTKDGNNYSTKVFFYFIFFQKQNSQQTMQIISFIFLKSL